MPVQQHQTFPLIATLLDLLDWR